VRVDVDAVSSVGVLGAVGRVNGVAETSEDSDDPEELYAATLKVYSCLASKPVIVVGDVEVEPAVQSVKVPDVPAR